jgi:hypothetical protein
MMSAAAVLVFLYVSFICGKETKALARFDFFEEAQR